VRLPWLAHDEVSVPSITIPQYRFNKIKQHTRHFRGFSTVFTLLLHRWRSHCEHNNQQLQAEAIAAALFVLAPLLLVLMLPPLGCTNSHMNNRTHTSHAQITESGYMYICCYVHGMGKARYTCRRCIRHDGVHYTLDLSCCCCCVCCAITLA